MHFKHLFIFPNYRLLKEFLRGLEDRAMYTTGGRNASVGWSRLSMMSSDGQHEITLGTVDDIEHERFRGRNFDKVSIHETVELNHRIHTFVQLCVGRASRALYGGLDFSKIVVDERVSPSEMYFLNNEFVEAMSHRLSQEIWATQPVKPMPFCGLISSLSV